eukprot:gnl/TRDRNA2_/TRDRNA2_125576_c0_seq1.p1 gnl/TRDRNA2_/TRDRNA2_125576_c0~~gnl/TRDRNA2_/TRDRNA2_125576_c0_seq1.p1  ORF type:complete len:157 (+),score=13.17 gnl/TRDRNA2_/TRDRNA2_125576_c0_seq1:105-575(+)
MQGCFLHPPGGSVKTIRLHAGHTVQIYCKYRCVSRLALNCFSAPLHAPDAVVKLYNWRCVTRLSQNCFPRGLCCNTQLRKAVCNESCVASRSRAKLFPKEPVVHDAAAENFLLRSLWCLTQPLGETRKLFPMKPMLHHATADKAFPKGFEMVMVMP